MPWTSEDPQRERRHARRAEDARLATDPEHPFAARLLGYDRMADDSCRMSTTSRKTGLRRRPRAVAPSRLWTRPPSLGLGSRWIPANGSSPRCCRTSTGTKSEHTLGAHAPNADIGQSIRAKVASAMPPIPRGRADRFPILPGELVPDNEMRAPREYGFR